MEQSTAFSWSTDEAKQNERFDYWRGAICAAFDPMSPELEKCNRDVFRGTVSGLQLGEAALMEIRASAHRTRRAPDDVSHGSGDYLFLYRQRAKAWFGFDYQDDFVTDRGTLCFGDADRPFATAPVGGANFHHCVLKLPRRMFVQVLARPHDIRTRVISAPTGIGALTAAYFDAFAAQAPHLLPEHRNLALQTLVSLTAAAYGHGCPEHDPRQAVRAAQLQVAKRTIEESLGQTDLTPGTVAERLGISVRLLPRLFGQSGTSVSRYIVSRRLDLARARLESPDRRHQTVVAIALDCGFDSLATFYRCFRRAFGMSPTDCRSMSGN
jgi:AraC-like DNA-binding protein